MTKIIITISMLFPLWIATIICGYGYGWQTKLPFWMDCVLSGYLGIVATLLVCGFIEIKNK